MECKYHVVFIPKYRKKSLYGWVRKELGPIMRGLAQQKEVVVGEGHLMPDHVHMLLSIRPKYSVSGVVGFIKGEERDSDRPAVYGLGEELCRAEFLARGYYVSTVGRDEEQIRNYIREQEKEDKRSIN